MEKKAAGKGLKSQKQAYLFLAPSLIILTIFVFVPLIGAIAISIMNINIYMNDISFAGLKNYLRMFSDARVGNATLNTFYFALLEVPLQILLALLLVMFMTKNTRWHKLMRTTFYLPYVCSMTAVSIMWSMLLNKNYGMLPYLLGKIGIQMPSLLTSTTWAMPTVIFVTVWKGFGYTLTVLSAAALGVSNSLYEAAELDGANKFQQFLHIILPSIKTIVTLNVILSITGALSAFEQPYVITDGANGTATYFINMNRIAHTNQKVGLASAMAVVLLLIIFACTILQKLFFKYIYRNADQTDEVMTKEERKRRKEYIKQKKAAKKGAA